MDPTAAEVSTDESMTKYRIGIMQLFAAVNIQIFQDDLEAVGEFFRRGWELAGSPRLTRVTAHTSDVAPVQSFDELRDALEGTLPNQGGLREAVGVPLEDFGLALDFSDEHWIVEVKIGPMREDELRGLFEAPKTVDFPPDALFLDVKAVMRRPNEAANALELWTKAFDRNRKITHNVDAWLREVLT
jgi:hypothetical protein